MLSRYLFCLQVRTLSANDTEGVLGWFVLVISGGLLVNGYNIVCCNGRRICKCKSINVSFIYSKVCKSKLWSIYLLVFWCNERFVTFIFKATDSFSNYKCYMQVMC